MKTPWGALEEIPGLIALPVTWRAKTGNDFQNFSDLCLKASQWLPRSYPCPRDPSCVYRIRRVSQPPNPDPQQFTAVCEREPPACERIQLTRADITPLELNWQKLARAICKAFGLDTKIGTLPIPHTIQIGSWSADAVPVILTIQTERHQLHFVISDLIASLHQRFILLAPTSQNLDAHSQERLINANAAFFPFETTVILTQNATLQPTKPPGELFAKFTAEEKLPEDAALRAFAVLKSLDTNEAIRKAPVFKVFRLYCMENLSVAQAAKKLKCSKATIINRLRVIGQKTGTDPENLRAFSAQFTSIEQSLSDPRARRIRRSKTEDPEAQQEE